MSPQLILIIVLALANVATLGYSRLHESIVVNASIKAERAQGVVTCNALRADDAQKINEAAILRQQDAMAAERTVEAVSDDKAARIADCERDPYCRTRKAKK